MSTAPLPALVQAFAPDFARRLGVILAALSALIARRFLRAPHLAALIVPLWRRLNRAARRFERLMARLAAGNPGKPHRSGPSGPHSSALPTGRGWLIRALGPEAAPYATQLAALLAEPAAAGLLAAIPAARRIVLPIARLLVIRAVARRQRPARVAAAPPLALSPSGEVASRSPGFTWYVIPTPPANPA